MDRLLDLQAIDTIIDQLRHRRETLPERAELVRLDERGAALTASVVAERSERHDIEREQKRLEGEIAVVEGKVEHVNARLYGGSLTSPKEAQDLQADLESLQRRQGTLEDEVLVLMERAEPLDDALGRVESELATIASERERVETALAAAESVVDAELESAKQRRAQAVEDIDAGALTNYDQLRRSGGGIAIARLQGSTCQGCHLSLAPAEVDAIKRQPPDAVINCPECGRLLVR